MMTAEEVVETVSSLAPNHVVLTGGEPMIFDQIEPICIALKLQGYIITIETAGTVYREVSCDLLSLSPKLSTSTPDGEQAEMHEKRRYQPDVLQKLVNHYPNHQLKFVVDPFSVSFKLELEEFEEIIAHLPETARSNVYLMPQGVEAEELAARERELVSVCLEKGYRLAPRQHIVWFGNTRGT
jgi:7-carboxy-7-deazaguanine synthase